MGRIVLYFMLKVKLALNLVLSVIKYLQCKLIVAICFLYAKLTALFLNWSFL